MLFTVYVMPMGQVIREFGVRWSYHDNNIQFYLSLSLDSAEAVMVLNRHLELVTDKKKANVLKVILSKTEVL